MHLFTEVIICTPKYPEQLVTNLRQNSAPVRGQEKGDSRLSTDQKQKQKDPSKQLNITLFMPILLGGIIALGIAASSIIDVPKAKAADRSWGNVDLAKKVIENVAPIVSDVKPDDTAPLVIAANDFIQKPMVVETQITPDPPAPKPALKPVIKQNKPSVKPVVNTTKSQNLNVDLAITDSSHRFPYGYCTYYVSQKRIVPWSGNAGTWLNGAKAFGFETGDAPRVGAIMVTSEGGYAGHVAYVEAVNGDEVTISEMNYSGFGRITSRTISASYRVIKGYIY